jgi:hypothetical protein
MPEPLGTPVRDHRAVHEPLLEFEFFGFESKKASDEDSGNFLHGCRRQEAALPVSETLRKLWLNASSV